MTSTHLFLVLDFNLELDEALDLVLQLTSTDLVLVFDFNLDLNEVLELVLELTSADLVSLNLPETSAWMDLILRSVLEYKERN